MGISEDACKFIHLFLLATLTFEDREITHKECQSIKHNFQQVVTQGRKPGLELSYQEKKTPLKELAYVLFDAIG